MTTESSDSSEAQFSIDDWIAKIEGGLPKELHGLLADDRAGSVRLARELPKCISAKEVTTRGRREAWENIGGFYLQHNRFPEAASIYMALYLHQLNAQETLGTRIHKGASLVWLSDCYFYMGYELIWRRYLMLTLIEDAIHCEGKIDPEMGVFIRAVPRGFLSESELDRYGKDAFTIFQKDPNIAMYPEAVLQRLDDDWITQGPSPKEAGVYLANTMYIKHLISNLGRRSDGKKLEELAEYLLSCMPGCRTQRRKRTFSTDYDIVCSLEGLEMDFRSELGRYFLCECKDRAEAADFTAMAKFCRVLDSVKARFGILFSSQGITGEGKSKYAEREQLKVFQDRGMVIVVLDCSDLERLAEGANFISLLRNRYEKVRLDLSGEKLDKVRPETAALPAEESRGE